MTKRRANPVKISNPNPDLIRLGKRIRDLRIEQGYASAEKFALERNLSRSNYSRWETGKKNITFKNLDTLCRAFGISLSKFFSVGFD